MSDTFAETGEKAVAELLHFGVKGMKWGVRNTDGSVGKRKDSDLTPKERAHNAAVAEKHAGTVKYSTAEIKAARARQQERAKEFQAVAAKADADRKARGVKAKDEGMTKEEADAYDKYIEQEDRYIAARKTVGEKAVRAWLTSGVTLYFDRDSRTVTRVGNQKSIIKHDSSEELREVAALLGVAEDEVVVLHYGVKGMKWGVRTNPDGTTSVDQTRVRKSLRSTDKAVTVSQRKAGTFVKTSGGQRQTASTDAIKTQAARQVAKKSTTDALSNKQLKDTIERMRLEQEFSKLDKKTSRRGRGFAKSLLSSPAARQAVENLVTAAQKNSS